MKVHGRVQKSTLLGSKLSSRHKTQCNVWEHTSLSLWREVLSLHKIPTAARVCLFTTFPTTFYMRRKSSPFATRWRATPWWQRDAVNMCHTHTYTYICIYERESVNRPWITIKLKTFNIKPRTSNRTEHLPALIQLSHRFVSASNHLC